MGKFNAALLWLGAPLALEYAGLLPVWGAIVGRSLGSGVAVQVANTEWPKWETVMSADPVDPSLLKPTYCRSGARSPGSWRRSSRWPSLGSAPERSHR